MSKHVMQVTEYKPTNTDLIFQGRCSCHGDKVTLHTDLSGFTSVEFSYPRPICDSFLEVELKQDWGDGTPQITKAILKCANDKLYYTRLSKDNDGFKGSFGTLSEGEATNTLTITGGISERV